MGTAHAAMKCTTFCPLYQSIGDDRPNGHASIQVSDPD